MCFFFFIYLLSIERLCIFLAGLVIREKKKTTKKQKCTILLEVRVCVSGGGKMVKSFDVIFTVIA